MSSTRNVKLATLFITTVSLHAITLSSKISFSESQLSFGGLTHYTPIYSDDPAKVFKFSGIASRSKNTTPMEFVSAGFQISGQYTGPFGLFGELGAHYSLHGSQIFASGSLQIQPYSFTPYIGIGGYYTAQNNAQIELGANIGYFNYDLNNTAKGTLFNGYTIYSSTDLNVIPTDINVNLTYPVTDRLYLYSGLSYGFSVFTSTLPVSETVPIKYQSALLAEPSGTTAAYIGDYLGRDIDININKLLIGLKLNIKDF